MIFHPTVAALSRFADYDCSEREERRIKRHLEKCSRCRSEVNFFREITAGIQNLPAPRPPTELWDAIVERFEDGEMVLLPSSGSVPRFEPAPVSRVRTTLVGALSVLVALLVWGSWDGAAAGGTHLTSVPVLDASGAYVESVNVTFQTASSLATEDSVRVRAEVFDDLTGDAHSSRVVETVFERSGPGTFSGTLNLPPRAVFGRIALEDLSGHRITAAEGGKWSFGALTTEGNPTPAALQQQFFALDFAPEGAAETAQEFVRLYPNDPRGWYYTYVLEDPPPTGAALRRYAIPFSKMHEQLRTEPGLQVEQAAAMYRLAEIVGRGDASDHWLEVLRERWPDHRSTARMWAIHAQRTHKAGSEELLTLYEQIWADGQTEAGIALKSLRLAAALERPPVEVRRWAERFLEALPDHGHALLDVLEGVPYLQDLLLRETDRILTAMDRDPSIAGLQRSVYETRPRFQHRLEERRAELLALTGEVMVERGQIDEGLRRLEKSASIGWRPERFRKVGQVRLTQGDTLGALEMFAREAADPLAEPNAIVERLTATRLELEYFRRLTKDALEHKEFQLAALLQDIPSDVSLTALRTDDSSVPLQSFTGEPLVVAFLSFRQDVQTNAREFLAVRDELASLPIDWLVVSRPEPNAGGDLEKERRLPGVDFVLDPTGSIAHSFGIWSTAEYAVLDSRARIRWTGDSLDDAVRIATLPSLAK